MTPQRRYPPARAEQERWFIACTLARVLTAEREEGPLMVLTDLQHVDPIAECRERGSAAALGNQRVVDFDTHSAAACFARRLRFRACGHCGREGGGRDLFRSAHPCPLAVIQTRAG